MTISIPIPDIIIALCWWWLIAALFADYESTKIYKIINKLLGNADLINADLLFNEWKNISTYKSTLYKMFFLSRKRLYSKEAIELIERNK